MNIKIPLTQMLKLRLGEVIRQTQKKKMDVVDRQELRGEEEKEEKVLPIRKMT